MISCLAETSQALGKTIAPLHELHKIFENAMESMPDKLKVTEREMLERGNKYTEIQEWISDVNRPTVFGTKSMEYIRSMGELARIVGKIKEIMGRGSRHRGAPVPRISSKGGGGPGTVIRLGPVTSSGSLLSPLPFFSRVVLVRLFQQSY